MAQIVHDLAPGADIAFATAFRTNSRSPTTSERLAAPVAAGGAEAEVLVDDIAYFEEPFFQDGPIGAAIDEVAGAGVTYFSAAGNDNLIDAEGNDIASWEAPAYRDTACPPEARNRWGRSTNASTSIPRRRRRPDLRDHGRTGGNAERRPAVGRTVVRRRIRPRRLPARRRRQSPDRRRRQRKNLRRQRRQQHRRRLRKHRAAGRVLRLGKRRSEEDVEVRLVVNRCFGTCNPGANAAAKPRVKVALLENGGGVTETEYPKSAGGDTVGPDDLRPRRDPGRDQRRRGAVQQQHRRRALLLARPRHPLLRAGRRPHSPRRRWPSRSRSPSPIWSRPTAA